MLNAIAKPFGMLVMWLYEVTNNYGLAIILFALIVKLILLPFQAKSKRSMMRTARLTPYVNDIKKRYAGNDTKINLETQKLYKEEGVNPMSGCIWSLIPFPIIIALYQAIRFPLTIMMGVPKIMVEEGGEIFKKLAELGYQSTMKAGYEQIGQAQFISNNFDKFAGIVGSNLKPIDFSFLGIDLGAMPKWNFLWTTDWSDSKVWLPGLGLFLIPIVAAVLTYLSSKIAQKTNPQNNDDPAAKSANSMMLMMPIMTLWFAFIMPASLGLYWIASSFFSIIQDVILSKVFIKKMAAEDAERNARMAAREAELEAKRKETERLRAMNATVQNKNTSKRKQYVKEREAQDAKAAEWEKAHRPQKEQSQNPGQVDDRKFARGRAYVADRFEAAAAQEPAAGTVEEKPELIEAETASEPVNEEAVTAAELGAESTEDVEDVDDVEDAEEAEYDEDDESDGEYEDETNE